MLLSAPQMAKIEDAGEDRGAAEQQRAVLLDLAGLHAAEELPGLFGARAGAVDGAVDDALVDVAVDEVAATARAGRRAVDDAVDDVLVEPVRASGDRALDAADDDVGVEVVEVVLVDEERVAGAGDRLRSVRPVERGRGTSRSTRARCRARPTSVETTRRRP